MKSKLHYITIATLFIFSAVGYAATAKESEVKKELETTTGYMQEMTEIRVHNGPDRSGLEVYEFRCKGCHARNTQGAPMPNDKFDWSMRMKKGFNVLMDHSMNGFNNYLMPPKGGCRDCNENEVRNAVIYMIESSGNILPESAKKNK